MAVLLITSQVAYAAGSQNLWPASSPAGSWRANTEWRTSTYGSGLLTRRTLIKAFLSSGEVLLLGSSSVGQNNADILVYNPGAVTGAIGTETIPALGSENFSCNAQRTGGGAPANQGRILHPTAEPTGPETIPARRGGGGCMAWSFNSPMRGR